MIDRSPHWRVLGAVLAEYIGQSCTLAQCVGPALGSCAGTRVALGHWYTRLNRVNP